MIEVDRIHLYNIPAKEVLDALQKGELEPTEVYRLLRVACEALTYEQDEKEKLRDTIAYLNEQLDDGCLWAGGS